MAELLEVNVDGSDFPRESSGQVLIPRGAEWGGGVFCQDLWSHLLFLFFDATLRHAHFPPILLRCKLQKIDNEITGLNHAKRRADTVKMPDSDLLLQGHRVRP
jgi:hypothetical protein